MRSHFRVVHARGNMIRARLVFRNRLFIEGIDRIAETIHWLDSLVAAQKYQGGTPNVGIIDSTGWSAFTDSDTIDTHPGWVEWPAAGNYESQSDPSTSTWGNNRVPWWYDAAGNGWVLTTREKLESAAHFTGIHGPESKIRFTASRTIQGLFLAGPGQTSTFGFGKYLLAAAEFAGGPLTVKSGDTMDITYELGLPA